MANTAQAQFEGLLLSFTNENNETRNQAEKLYTNAKKQQPNQVMQALIQIARTSASEALRSMAMVLLRRALLPGITEETFWSTLSLETQTLLKQQLLLGVEKEPVSKVRTAFCEAVTCVASDIFAANANWEGFLEWLLKISQSTEPHNRESALIIFAQLAESLKDMFKGENFKVIAQLLQGGLHESSPTEVRLAGLNATCQFLGVFSEREYRTHLQYLIPAMLETIAAALNQEDEESAQEALKSFVEMAENDAGFFKPVLAPVVGAMFKIAAAPQLDEPTRQLSLEFLISLVENKPNMCKAMDGFPQTMIDLLLQWMLELPDLSIEQWNLVEEDQDDIGDEADNSLIAQEGLDRICEPLGGDVVAPIVFGRLPQFLSHEKWEYRYVGLMALSMTAEGCRDVLLPSLEKIVSVVLPAFVDPHPRVRWAAANVAGQLATDFGPKIQKHFHSQLVPRFTALLDDSANPKVQSHMAAALINFCEKFDARLIQPYMNDLLSRLFTLIKTPTRMVQEKALTAVGAIASCAGAFFLPYYSTFIPFLKILLTQAVSEDQKILRGKAMETFSLIGQAVGKETFKADVTALLDVLGTIKTTELEADDPQRDFIVETWMRVSTSLGSDFVPYLRFIVPPLLQTAQLDAQISVSDASIVAEEEQQPGWEFLDVGDQRVKIHTVALEEKASACHKLLCFATDMKEGFFPWVEEVSRLMHPLMDFDYHDGVKMAAIQIVPYLLICAKAYGEQNNGVFHTSLFDFLFPPLVDAIRRETDAELLLVGIGALHKTISTMGPNSLSPDQIASLVHDTCLLVTSSIERRKELLGQDPDEEDGETPLRAKDEIEEEDDILLEVAELVGALVSTHPTLFMNSFQNSPLFQLIGQMIQTTSAAAERQLALCLFDDVVEHGKNLSFPLWEPIVPFMINYAQDPHVGVRQASCYGLGVLAKEGGELFKPIFRPTLEALLTTIQKPGSRDDEKTAPPTENGISSVGKIIQFQQACFSGNELQDLVNLWISWLPIEYDEVEAKALHLQFCQLIMTNTELMFGPNAVNLPKILTIFAMCLADPDLIEDIAIVKQLLTKMQTEVPPQLLESAFSVLPQEHQDTLKMK